MMKRLLPQWLRFVALTFTLCALAWILLTVWAVKFSREKSRVKTRDTNYSLRHLYRSVKTDSPTNSSALKKDNLTLQKAIATEPTETSSNDYGTSTAGQDTFASVEEDTSLREFQSVVEEESRLLRVLLDTPNQSALPKITAFDCPRLWAGDVDDELLQEADNVTRNCTCTSRDYPALTLNCTSYLLDSGFRLASVSEEELSFPLAFSLLAYKDVEQVERLLRAIYRPHNVYCVHVDRKSDIEFQSSLRLIVGCLPNAYILETSIDVQWGKYSVLEPELECMRRLWSHPARWRYFINLTGQEFPLKTNKELVKILEVYHEANDITGTHDSQFHFRWRDSLPAPHDLQISKGSVLIVATRGYVDYVVNSGVSRDLQEWVRHTRIPDESFFSTLNHNPKLGVPGSYTDDLDLKSHEQSFARYKIWHFENENLCSGKFVRWVCHFGVGDLPRLTNAPMLFANKFSYEYQPLAYDCLEEWYFQKVYLENSGQPVELDVSLYENSDMVKNAYTGPVQIWD